MAHMLVRSTTQNAPRGVHKEHWIFAAASYRLVLMNKYFSQVRSRQGVLLGALVVLLLVLAACAQSEPASATEAESVSLRLGTLRGPTAVAFAPLLAEPGSLGDSNYELEAEVFATPDLLVSQILTGSIDVATVPTNLASVLYNREADLQLAGVIGTGVLYLVADSPLDWDDLHGRTVYTIARGATPDILFRALATEAGLVPGVDFQVEYAADQVELAQSLIAGRRNLAVLPEPFVTRVTKGSTELQPALDLQREWTRLFGAAAVGAAGASEAPPSEGYPMTALVVSTGFASEHPAGLAALIESYKRGLVAFAEDPAATSAVAAALDLGLDAATIEAALPRLNMTWIPATEARQDVEFFLEVLASENPASIGGRLPAADFFLPGPE
ncbi:MAG: hypothetical protein EA428_01795 [Spirochaetaceae bacterium]|nr:MAG: hypothetical protein EA428_01795 [Spirochaetaceae bacterium]